MCRRQRLGEYLLFDANMLFYMIFKYVGSFEGGHTIRTLVPSFVRMRSDQSK